MIYLDHNATTPILPEVLEAMMPYLTSEWGNPSSSYKFGSKLKTVIETARAQVAELIGAHASEIIFTSCATESNNAAIHAASQGESPQTPHHHIGGGTFIGAELLQGPRKGGLPGHLSAR